MYIKPLDLVNYLSIDIHRSRIVRVKFPLVKPQAGVCAVAKNYAWVANWVRLGANPGRQPQHRLTGRNRVSAQKLADETLITCPVALERIDIYNRFLLLARCAPKKHKTIGTNDIVLQMVASGCGVTTLAGLQIRRQIATEGHYSG